MDEPTGDVDQVDHVNRPDEHGPPATPSLVDAPVAPESQELGEAWPPPLPSSRRRGSRQTRENGNPRSVRHVVRVHPDTELALIAKAAAAGNISVPRLLVQSALAGGAEAAAGRAEFADELYRLVRLVGKVGVNVNQIARATNATLEEQPDTFAAMEAVARVCGRVEAFLAQLDTGIAHGLDPVELLHSGSTGISAEAGQ